MKMGRRRSAVLCGLAALLAAVLGVANAVGGSPSVQSSGDTGGTTACGVTSAEYSQAPKDCDAV
ncbi:hypothetical protein GCM10020358_71510 [Amorphoplanes nipponensis]|uniref:Uncharacterized protein n=1 Tax=Actinoplanes nipponensis TaxID=135950 RepID=A0A919MJ37_9ACTN|nr:hypothetical protein Ani05nite_05950 [Actinoplanes nipponensis]